MISFACPKCGKNHTARDRNAGRRGFCDCGAVMLVPGTEVSDQNQAPKLVGHLDLHSAQRHARYMKIGSAIIGTVLVIVVVCALYFRNAWDRENRPQLLTLKGQADAFVQGKEYEKAKGKYDELFGLLGDRVVVDDDLKAEIDSARLAVIENNKKVETILTARAEIERKKHLAQNATAKVYYVNLKLEEVTTRRIKVAVNTNFPDNTNLHVWVFRVYFEKGSSLRYSGDIFAEDRSVNEGRIDLEIPINDSYRIAERNSKRVKFQKLGIWSEIDRISPDIEVTVLHSSMRSQPDAVQRILGRNGENVDGPQVQKLSDYAAYSVSEAIRIPFLNLGG